MTLDPKSLQVWERGSTATALTARELDRTFPSPNDVGTYPGHGEVYSISRGLISQNSPGQFAIDRMTASAHTTAGRAEGDRIAAWAIANADRLGIRYVIWNKRIWSRTGPTPGKWRAYVNPVTSRRGTPSGDHTNHVHISRYCDVAYRPPSSSPSPSAPSGTVPASTGKAFMSDRLDFYAREDQPLVPGDNVVWLGPLAADGQHPLSLLTKPTADVDVTATVDVRGTEGEPYSGAYALVFRTVAYQKGTPTTTVDDELAVLGSNQARYAGPFTTAPAKGKSNRLRLVLVVPEGVTGLVLHRAAFSGWTA